MSEFCVLAVSNASTDVHGENSTTNFTNIFPHSLTLRGNWQVALQTISFTNNLTNLPSAAINGSPDHILISPGKASTHETLLKINIFRKFYTPQSLNSYLQLVTTSAIDKVFSTRLDEKNQLNLVLDACIVFIQETICLWLKIDVGDRPRRQYGRDWYIEFDARKNNLILNSETDSYGEDKVPSFVKLHLKEMKPTLSGSGFHQDIAVIPYKQPEADQQLFFYEASQKEYYKLSDENLQSLTLKLCEENNEELKLISGQPTFVKLKFRNMDSSGSFQVRLSSQDSSNIFPENTSSNFRVQLPRELMLDRNNWEVALTTFNYPAKIDHTVFLTPKDFWLRIVFNSQEPNWQSTTFNFERTELVSGTTIASAISNKVAAKYGENVLKASILIGGRMQFETFARAVTLHMSPLFARVIGDVVVSPPQKFHEGTIQKSSKASLPGNVNLSCCLPQNVLLHCDIVSPTITGGKYCNVLKLVPISLGKRERNFTSYVSQHLDFVDVASDRVQNIEFRVQTADGDQVQFSDPTAPSYVTIMFRRKMK